MNAEEIENRLKKGFPDCDVAVIDTNGGGNHFDVRIATSAFKGLSRISQHKAVFSLFDDELKTGELHALALKTIIK
jgi:stress-induced morphogen